MQGFKDSSLVWGTLASLKRIVIGYSLSLILGTCLGLLIGRSRCAQNTIGSLVIALQSLPSICWLPVAILWFGLSDAAIQMVVIMGALLSITISTVDGVRNVPPIYLKAAGTLGIEGPRFYFKVLLPAILPSVVTGMKLGWSFAWRSLMSAELIFISVGLGNLLNIGRELNDINQIVAIMFIIVAIGMSVDRTLFAYLEKQIRLRWGYSS